MRTLRALVCFAIVGGSISACATSQTSAAPVVAQVVAAPASVDGPPAAAPVASAITPPRHAASHEIPARMVLDNLQLDHPQPTRVLLVNGSSPAIVEHVAFRRDRIDVVEADEARFDAAQKIAHGALTRCPSVPAGLRRNATEALVPCHDPATPYGAIVVDCSRAQSPAACAWELPDPMTLAPAVSLYVYLPIAHHVAASAPFRATVVVRTKDGFDVVAVPSTMPRRAPLDATWSLRAQPLARAGDDDDDRPFYGCRAGEGALVLTPFADSNGDRAPHMVVPDDASDRVELARTKEADAKMLRDELLVDETLGPRCYTLWSFDARLREGAVPNAKVYLLHGHHEELWPSRAREVVAAYELHANEATKRMTAGDLEGALEELRVASGVLEGGFGAFAPHTVRGFLVPELTRELSLARESDDPIEYARAIARFRAYSGSIEKKRELSALFAAAKSFALARLDRAPPSKTITRARAHLVGSSVPRDSWLADVDD